MSSSWFTQEGIEATRVAAERAQAQAAAPTRTPRPAPAQSTPAPRARATSYTSHPQAQGQRPSRAQAQAQAQGQTQTQQIDPSMQNGYAYGYEGRVPQFPSYQYPTNHYADAYTAVRDTAATSAERPGIIPPYPTTQPVQSQPDEVPPGGWGIPRSLDARLRRMETGQVEEDEDERPGRRRRRTLSHPARPRSQSRGRAATVMTPTTAAASLTGGYAALSLHGTDTIKIANLQGVTTLEYISATVNHFWPPGCTITRDGFNVVFKMNGRPWIATGDDGLRARRVLTRIYTVLATNGYAFVCSSNTGAVLSSPVQMFLPDSAGSLQTTSIYLGLTVSSSRRKITLIDVPPPLAQKVKKLVRNYFPDCALNTSPPRLAAYASMAEEEAEDPLLAQGTVIVRLPGLLSSVKVPQFGMPRPYETTVQNVLGHVQYVLSTSGFFLCGTIPMDLPLVSIRRRELNLYRSMGHYWGGY